MRGKRALPCVGRLVEGPRRQGVPDHGPSRSGCRLNEMVNMAQLNEALRPAVIKRE